MSVEEKTIKKPPVKVQIDQVKLRHEDLSKNISTVKHPSEILPEVRVFIAELRAMGRDVPPGANRDLLISLASFWATYYFQHSEENTYPQTTLEPYLGPAKGEGTITGVFQQVFNKEQAASSWGSSTASETSVPERAASWFLALPLVGRILLIGAPLLLIGILAVVLLGGGGGTTATATPTLENLPTADLAGTQVAMESTSVVETLAVGQPVDTLIALATATAVSAGGIETPAAEVTATAALSETPLATQPPATPTLSTGGPGIENQGVSVSIDNLADLQQVLPETWLNLSFSNFSPGWSIHLLLQPLSKGLTYYPAPDFYLVEEGYPSGMWTARVNFGSGADLDYREQYAITPVMATSEAARQALADAQESGLEQLPEGVFTSPQLITRVYTVVRQAYTVVNEVRLVYSSYPPKQTNTDLFAMLPDGTDPLQLTDTPEIGERYPDISPTGAHIVFVGRTQESRDAARMFSLWVMSSDNSNRFIIAQDPAVIYDRPLWSPEGDMIAYNTSPADATVKGSLSSWAIYLYDMLSGRNIRLDTGLTYARHPTWAPDGRALYFSALNPESGTLGLYRISLDTQEVSRVYDEKGNEIQPMVSPDGNRLLFQEYDSGEFYILDLASGRVELVPTPRALDLGYAVWSPDGASIYFEMNVASGYSVWMINLADGNPVQLRPDGTQLDPTVGLLVASLPK